MKVEVTGKEALCVCYFGTYSLGKGYPRNRVIIEGLRRNEVNVIECHEDFWNGTEEKIEGLKTRYLMVKTFWKLLWTYVRLIYKFKRIGYYDALIVGYAGHLDIFLAKILNLFRRRPIIFDAFLSIYDTSVQDRKIVPPSSLKAKLLWQIDKWSCSVSDAVLLDTQAHINYFVKEFQLPAKKFFAVPVGSYLPPHLSSSPQRVVGKNGFEILYFGTYIPLHGVDIILKAAKILQEEKDIVFTLVGKGQLLSEMKQLSSEMGLKNVNFIDRFVEEGELTSYIEQADICLGIFGMTAKAMRVIPCKVYNCLAMGKPLITGMTPAIEGVLTHMGNSILCRPGVPEDLSNAILLLKNDKALREKIASNGTEYFYKNFSMEAIGKNVVHIVESMK